MVAVLAVDAALRAYDQGLQKKPAIKAALRSRRTARKFWERRDFTPVHSPSSSGARFPTP